MIPQVRIGIGCDWQLSNTSHSNTYVAMPQRTLCGPSVNVFERREYEKQLLYYGFEDFFLSVLTLDN